VRSCKDAVSNWILKRRRCNMKNIIRLPDRSSRFVSVWSHPRHLFLSSVVSSFSYVGPRVKCLLFLFDFNQN
jgi:hypothetical protein